VIREFLIEKQAHKWRERLKAESTNISSDKGSALCICGIHFPLQRNEVNNAANTLCCAARRAGIKNEMFWKR
jgi:hypothetical protein